jgi:phosphoribosylglycinamide formyltransferase 1
MQNRLSPTRKFGLGPFWENAIATPSFASAPNCSAVSKRATDRKGLWPLRLILLMHNLGILISGRGSNFLAIADAIDTGTIPNACIAVVISNIASAPGLEAARQRGLTALAIEPSGRKRAEHDQEIVATLQAHHVSLVCLAGYMRLLSPGFVQAFPHRILNIHPSLLPAFPGLDALQQAFDYGVQVTGCTVHFVDEQLDHGPIILQRSVPVLPTDDAHSLAARILEQEHLAYPEAIARVLSGNYEIAGRRYLPGPQAPRT